VLAEWTNDSLALTKIQGGRKDMGLGAVPLGEQPTLLIFGPPIMASLIWLMSRGWAQTVPGRSREKALPITQTGRLKSIAAIILVAGLQAGCGGGGGQGGGGSSSNPAPSISTISPPSAAKQGSAFTMTVTGTGFVQGSQIEWNKSALATTYVSSTSLSASVPASDLSNSGSASVTVVSPTPGGGTSNAVTFTIGNPVAVLASMTPTSAMTGSSALTVTISGSNFLSGSQVEWNGTALSTTFVNATTLTAQIPGSDLTGSTTTTTAAITVVNPTPGGGVSNSLSFSVLAPSSYYRKIDLAVNSIVWDSTHGKIYASLPSTDTNGNSIVAIDPVAETVGTLQAAGKEPDALAISDDNTFLYVANDGSGIVTRYNLPALTQDSTFNVQLPTGLLGYQLTALSMAVAPGAPHTFAARLGTYSLSPNDIGGIAIFDDAIQRTNLPPSPPNAQQDVQWGADAKVLYASAAVTSGALTILSASASGVTVSDTLQNFEAEFANIHYVKSNGLIYLDGGWVLDPLAKSMVTTFDLNPLIYPFNPIASYGSMTPLCIPDVQNGAVYFLGQTPDQYQAASGVTLEKFDATTYQLLQVLSLNGPTGHPGKFLRWSTAGLAFTMAPNPPFGITAPGAGPLYLVDGAFVAGSQMPDSSSGIQVAVTPQLAGLTPQSAAAGGGPLTLTVTGKNFTPTTALRWNGGNLATTFVSDTQLQATVPAGDIALPGTAIVSTVDSSTQSVSLSPLAFTITAQFPGTTLLSGFNLAGTNIAWDPVSQQLLIPVWSADGQYANTVVGMNPSTGAIEHTAAVFAEPYAFGVTDDGKYIYTGYETANTVTRLSLPNLDSPMSWKLPVDPNSGPLWAFDIAPEPAQSRTVAVSLAATNRLPATVGGIEIYDDGVARPSGIADSSNFSTSEYLQWDAGSNLYLLDSGTVYDLFTYGVSSSGLTYLQNQNIAGNFSPTQGGREHYDSATGYLYIDNGEVVNPATGLTVGAFGSSGFLVVDATLNRVFILGQVGAAGWAINSYDKTTYGAISSIMLPQLVGKPIAFIRWGTNGLAFVTFNEGATRFGYATSGGPAAMLYVISDTSFVSEKRTAVSGTGVLPVHDFPRVEPLTARRGLLGREP
jgi:sugar lactone lactonase YvrE